MTTGRLLNTSAGVATRLLDIPQKRTNQRPVGYLTRPAILAIVLASGGLGPMFTVKL
jgi:hypothetical protein